MSFIKNNILQGNTRFNTVIDIYLSDLEYDDIKYLTPDDLINLVPKDRSNEVLLMTILVKRYIMKSK